jgi:hypothetical protein
MTGTAIDTATNTATDTVTSTARDNNKHGDEHIDWWHKGLYELDGRANVGVMDISATQATPYATQIT